MPQFFIDREIVPGSEIEIRGRDARHILQSLRLAPGDGLMISDGRGRSYRSMITDCGTATVRARIECEVVRPEGATPPALAIASIRSERLEWAAQKAVELGCRRIIVFNSARTVRRARGGQSSSKVARLGRIAQEAAKQSGAPFTPHVDGPVEFAGLLSELGTFEPKIILHEGRTESDMRGAIGGARRGEGIIIVGPEGGFTEGEVKLATDAGCVSATLGSQILRVETAAVTALAIYQHEIGNLG